MLVTQGKLDINTGETTTESAEWVTRECGIPLFGEKEQQSGVCKSCSDGWTHPLNFPVRENAPQQGLDFA
jgi:hypothetical protein